MARYNFPEHLNIHPSSNPSVIEPKFTELFGFSAQQSSIQNYGIAGRVWEAAYLLNQYVQPSNDLQFQPPFRLPLLGKPHALLELGSGTGIISHHVSRRLTRECDILIATDLPEVCHLLERNLLSSTPSLVQVRPLAWGNDEHWLSIAREFLIQPPNTRNLRTLSHVICSDLVYFPELLAPLLRTLIATTNPIQSSGSAGEGSVTVLISYKIRSLSKETPFWQAFGLWFKYEPVLVRKKGATAWKLFSSFDGDTTFIFVAHRREDSYLWQVPADDIDLLAGKGAKGSNIPKSDDYFDSLLLMTLDDSDE